MIAACAPDGLAHVLCVHAFGRPSGEAGLRELDVTFEGSPHLAFAARQLVELLFDLTGCERVGVRLASVVSAMCPRLHVDQVTLRVVTTLCGSGTQYVADADVDRSRLGHAAGGKSDEVSGALRVPHAIRSALPGDVVILKGNAWPGARGRGAVHRSPAASVDAPRLVMTLDPLA